MAEENLTLLIKHLPSELTASEQEDMLRHFGATAVKTMGNKGRMKYCAFAVFPDHETAAKALKKLHQLEILGRRLVAEFSNSQQRKHHPSVIDTSKEPTVVEKKSKEKKTPVVRVEEIDMKKVAENVNAFSRNWEVNYAMDPRLEYTYPQPTVNILTNIANALASVPRFYVQVLHLMNKMNLPAPFGAVTPTPVLPEGKVAVDSGKEPLNQSTTSTLSELKRHIERANESSEESELESEEDSHDIMSKSEVQPKLARKRKSKSLLEPRKRLKLVQNLTQIQKSKTKTANPADVFEQPEVSGPKKIAFNLSRFEEQLPHPPPSPPTPMDTQVSEQKQSNIAEIGEITSCVEAVVMEPLPGAPPLPPPQEPIEPEARVFPETEISVLSSTQENDNKTENAPANGQKEENIGGFGKFEPTAQPEDIASESSEEEWGQTEFISSKALRRGRISSSEKRDHSVFKNYQKGESSTRLYIKNIGKKVTEKDLHYVFGRYVDWSNEVHKNMFDIRLMKEGRMKGQAFVTLPTVVLAEEAVKATHGFMLLDKPIAVQFARSAKPKDEPSKKENSKRT